jgi:hypothetical protein
LLAGTCRHQIPQKMANIIGTGERYAYAHFLMLSHFLPKRKVRNVHMDIMCKFSPYATNVKTVLSNLPTIHEDVEHTENTVSVFSFSTLHVRWCDTLGLVSVIPRVQRGSMLDVFTQSRLFYHMVDNIPYNI